jgi:hypothetical protein
MIVTVDDELEGLFVEPVIVPLRNIAGPNSPFLYCCVQASMKVGKTDLFDAPAVRAVVDFKWNVSLCIQT